MVQGGNPQYGRGSTNYVTGRRGGGGGGGGGGGEGGG